MKTNLTSDSMMVGESLQRPADLGVLTRPVRELAQQQDVGVLRFTPDGPAKTPVAPTAAGEPMTECYHPPRGRRPPAYTEPWRGVYPPTGRRPLDPCRRPPPDHFPPGDAMQFAEIGLRSLRRIAPDDRFRAEALEKIAGWLKGEGYETRQR